MNKTQLIVYVELLFILKSSAEVESPNACDNVHIFGNTRDKHASPNEVFRTVPLVSDD